MSGAPTQTEIQTQWRNVVDLLESTRAYADGTVAGAGAILDTLFQSLEGEFTPTGVASAALRYRAGLSTLIDPGRARELLTPIMFEYARLFSDGSGYSDLRLLLRALYEHFVTNTLSVKTRAITYDSSATLGGTNVGNGAITRLTVDENNFPLEACTVETKRFRCRGDQNTGFQENAESFECIGQAASYDALLRASNGSGDTASLALLSKHAGSGRGGSLLRNSSFSSFSATATPKFTGWTESAGGASLSQDTTNFYRSHPNSPLDASLKITGGAGTVTIKHPLTAMAVTRLDERTPYFLRVMLNKTVGTASGGSVTVRLGSQTVTSTIAGLGAGWVELMIPAGTGCWLKNFNQDDLDIEIEWSSSSSGFLLVDDVIFAPWDLIDGTYWVIRGNSGTHIAWLVNDTLTFTDTGGAPTTGIIQWWLWVGFGIYLPSSGSPTFTDPT